MVSGSSTTPSESTKALRPIGAVRHGGDVGAHLLGGAAAQFGDRRDHGFVAVAVEDGEEPLLADKQRRGLGADVADALVGDADVGAR